MPHVLPSSALGSSPPSPMPVKRQLLIDMVVRHTSSLIAALSTAEGGRSPLNHIVDEVFAGLSRELEKLGVRHTVAADMFGMALRSYRQKVQRLRESETSPGETLWGAMHTFIAESPGVTLQQIKERFPEDEELTIRGLLRDMIENGWLFSSGKGAGTRYRVPSKAELREIGARLDEDSVESLAALIWLQLYREGEMTRDSIQEFIHLPTHRIDEALAFLTSEGRVEVRTRDGGEVFASTKLLIPVGEEAGWEAAVVDHHRVVCNALAAKFAGPRPESRADDLHGGTTLSFDIWPGHPHEKEVRRLLADVRAQALPLWEDFVEFQGESRPGAYKVHFYFGQYLSKKDENS